MTIADEVVDSWRIHNRITLYLLDAIPDEALGDRAGGKGRTVGRMLAHLHAVRLMWLKPNDAEAAAALPVIAEEETEDRGKLAAALMASGEALATFVEGRLAAGKRPSGFKPHTPAFVAYLIAHEAYHHGEIGGALSQSGHPLPNKVAYGMWEWGVR